MCVCLLIDAHCAPFCCYLFRLFAVVLRIAGNQPAKITGCQKNQPLPIHSGLFGMVKCSVKTVIAMEHHHFDGIFFGKMVIFQWLCKFTRGYIIHGWYWHLSRYLFNQMLRPGKPWRWVNASAVGPSWVSHTLIRWYRCHLSNEETLVV